MQGYCKVYHSRGLQIYIGNIPFWRESEGFLVIATNPANGTWSHIGLYKKESSSFCSIARFGGAGDMVIPAVNYLAIGDNNTVWTVYPMYC